MVLTGYKTDVGIKKEVNQDSLIIRKAMTEVGEVTFISVCDGMGGLSFGELASAEAVNGLKIVFCHAQKKLMRKFLNTAENTLLIVEQQ